MKRYTIQPYAIHMTFTATVLSPDADTQATVESDWKAGAEHKYRLFFGLFVTCPASTTTGTRSVPLHKASVFQHNHFVFKSRKVDAFGRKRR